MPHKDKDLPVLFLLEDDPFLLNEIREFAEQAGWRVISSRCIEDAKVACSVHVDEVRLAIVDMMVPNNVSDLQTLKVLESAREEYIQSHFPEMNDITRMNGAELAQTRSDLRGFDKDIRRVVDFDGGRILLKHLANDGSKCAVVVFSARLDPGDCEQVTQLKSQARWRGWLPKPIDPMVLGELLAASVGHFDER